MEFNPSYGPPPGTNYGVPSEKKKLEAPIYPMSEVGITIPEIDPSGRHKNLIQIAQAAIRGGSGTMQLMFMVPHTQAAGGRPHMYGKDVRQQLKEIFAAGGVNPVGVELPTSSMTNVSGLDLQRGTISEETRKQHLDEIKAAINFTADVFQGGGTDIVSWEFPRTLYDATWNKSLGTTEDGKEKLLFENFPGEGDRPVLRFVDEKTNQVVPIPVNEIPLQRDPENPDVETEKWHYWTWNNFRQAAKVLNERGVVDEQGNPFTPHSLLKKEHFETQISIAKAEASNRRDIIERQRETDVNYLNAIRKKEEGKGDELTEKERERLEYFQEQEKYIQSQKRQARDYEKKIAALKPLEEFAKEKAVQSYAELGLFAMQEEAHHGGKLKQHLYVGPEIGWPHAYGGHPDEFIELVKTSRAELQKKLMNGEFEGKKYTEKQAEALAHQHIKGTFDSGHMGMWLKHFRPDLPHHDRIKQFNEWYKKKAEKIAAADVTGTIQIVDAYGGEHGHLPPGQGIFPIKEAMESFKKHNFHGHIVSEGHEEEKYEQGRIRTTAWNLMRSPTSQYAPAHQFSQVHHGYFGRTYAPRQMFGSYTPPFGEYKPWSDLPFE